MHCQRPEAHEQLNGFAQTKLPTLAASHVDPSEQLCERSEGHAPSVLQAIAASRERDEATSQWSRMRQCTGVTESTDIKSVVE